MNLIQLKPCKLSNSNSKLFIPQRKTYRASKKVATKYELYTNLHNNISLISNGVFYFTFFYTSFNFLYYQNIIKKVEKDKEDKK